MQTFIHTYIQITNYLSSKTAIKIQNNNNKMLAKQKAVKLIKFQQVIQVKKANERKTKKCLLK